MEAKLIESANIIMNDIEDVVKVQDLLEREKGNVKKLRSAGKGTKTRRYYKYCSSV